MKTLLFALLLCAVALFGQDSVNSDGLGYTQLMYYDGSSNLEYVCTALSTQPTTTVSVAGKTLTSIVVSSNTGTVNWTAHGLAVGNPVTVSGGTGDTDLNGTYYVQTVPGADSFTITTASVSDATYTDATLTITTTAPRNNRAIWSIRKFRYSGTSMLSSQWAGGNSSMQYICANRATSTGATKVTYW